MTKEEALKEVAKRIAVCEQCKYQPNQNPVPGEGSPDAEIMFVGEAPGKKENETGRPFVGAAGKFLNEMLNSIGLEREDIFIANVIKYQPPGNRDPLPEEIVMQLPFLKKQIAIIKPKLVCFLGRHSMTAFLPDIGPISKVHGQLIWKEQVLGTRNSELVKQGPGTRELELDGKLVPSSQSLVPAAYLPLYHPAAALYNGGMRQTLLDDFAKIPEYMDKIKR